MSDESCFTMDAVARREVKKFIIWSDTHMRSILRGGGGGWGVRQKWDVIGRRGVGVSKINELILKTKTDPKEGPGNI